MLRGPELRGTLLAPPPGETGASRTIHHLRRSAVRTQSTGTTHGRASHASWAVAVCLLAALLLFFPWAAQKEGVIAALPYALLFLCPVIHLLMHRRRHGPEA